LAGAYRAPLAAALPLDGSLWVEGQTGSLKSTLVALILSHFGSFDRLHLPGAWSSTANQLERRAFVLKDTMFVVDDYAPGADARDLEIKAQRILRAQGNLAGRCRRMSMTDSASTVRISARSHACWLSFARICHLMSHALRRAVWSRRLLGHGV
jgi:hypothetical protein